MVAIATPWKLMPPDVARQSFWALITRSTVHYLTIFTIPQPPRTYKARTKFQRNQTICDKLILIKICLLLAPPGRRLGFDRKWIFTIPRTNHASVMINVSNIKVLMYWRREAAAARRHWVDWLRPLEAVRTPVADGGGVVEAEMTTSSAASLTDASVHSAASASPSRLHHKHTVASTSSSVWGRAPLFPLVHLLPRLFPLLLFPFFYWLYLFSSFVHPFPFYQNSPTPFPGRRS